MVLGQENTGGGTSRAYGLHESVVSVDVLDKVRKARAEVEVAKDPDILGLRGSKWQATVNVTHVKHTRDASDLSLANTLTPQHLNPKDARTITRPTHSPVRRVPVAELERSSPGSGGWNASTYYERSDMLRGAEAVTSSSLKKTLPRADKLLESKGGRASLVEQVAQLNERIRAEKAAQGVDIVQLEAQYGKEGAQHMLEIMSMPKREKPSPEATRRRARATKADLAAVRDLPDDVLDSHSSADSTLHMTGSSVGSAGPVAEPVATTPQQAEAYPAEAQQESTQPGDGLELQSTEQDLGGLVGGPGQTEGSQIAEQYGSTLDSS